MLWKYALELFMNVAQQESNDKQSYSQQPVRSVCSFDFSSSNCKRALRIERTTTAGLGHQISEIVFGMQLATSQEATLMYEPFQNESSHHEVQGYEFVGRLLGLDTLVMSETQTSLNYTRIDLHDNTNTACNVLVEGPYTGCIDGDCFRSGALALAFENQAPCLKYIARTAGDWAIRSPFQDDGSLNIVWHIRVGDIEPHPPTDIFYENLFYSLQPFLSSFKHVIFYFISEWGQLPAEKAASYRTRLSRLSHNSKFISKFISPGIEDAMLFLMHSDLIIGSGSSLPLIAATFSDKTVYVNAQPKHGWNFLADFLADGLIVRDDGIIVNHLLEIRKKWMNRNPQYWRKLHDTADW